MIRFAKKICNYDRIHDYIYAVAFGLLLGAFFYRGIILSGFDVVFGDSGDARLAMMLMEHWHMVFSGNGSFFSPIFFYPTKDVIGFTDANFLYGVVFTIFRWLGLTTYGSFQAVVIIWEFLGYSAMFWLLRYIFQLNIAVSVLFAGLFGFSNVNALQVGHMQLLTVSLIPLIFGLTIIFIRQLESRTKTFIAAGYAIAIIYPLMLFTGFYISWYLLLYAATASLIISIFNIVRLRRVNALRLGLMLQRSWKSFCGIAVVGIVSSMPFVVAYGPQLVGNPGFSIDPLFQATIPHISDLLNVGPENFVWGSILTNLLPSPYSRLGGYELLMGMPPGFFLLFIISSLIAFWNAWKTSANLASLLAVCVWIGLLTIVQVQGYSLWWLVRLFVPGATAIRVVSRYEVLLYPFALITTAVAASHYVRYAIFTRSTWKFGVFACIAAFLIIEQIQPQYAKMSKSEELARLDPIPPPPEYCRQFILNPSRNAETANLNNELDDGTVRRLQVDAIYEAMRYNIPTVNGLSSLNPNEYWFFDLSSTSYPLSAGMWLNRNNLLSDICTLDFDKAAWSILRPDAAPFSLGINLLNPPPKFNTLSSAMRQSDAGFVGPPPQMWTGSHAQMTFSHAPKNAGIQIEFVVANPRGSDVAVGLNHVMQGTKHFDFGTHAMKLSSINSSTEINLEILSDTFRPSKTGNSSDSRDLGILITSIEFSN